MKIWMPLVLGLLVSLGCTSSMAAAVLKLSRTELTLEPGKPINELYVENIGDAPLYLNVEQHLLTNPGNTPEQLVPVTEVRKPSLLVLPGKLVLAPGQKYRMVLKALGIPARTLVWRVTFRPKERVVIDARSGNDLPTPLFVSVGYGVVIYQKGAMS
ncbi:hypothetical protein QZM18_08215 [Burkholderia diffusa]|nr:hypothetical protein [Burkholderia diffusa]MDN7904113.1 hypothetical protein [Burkholderia diffusa]